MRNEEYLLYQTLARHLADRSRPASLNDSRERGIHRAHSAYMAKALKEAKLNTSWIQPNEAVGRGDG